MRANAVLLAVLLMVVLAPPAAASFPGRNGLIAVSGDGDTDHDTIWVGRADGSGLRALPSPCPPGPIDVLDRCFADAPAWSPDGTRLAFTVIRGSTPQLWVVNADGSGLREVPGAHGYSPAWSPSGERLVFSVDAPDARECHFRDLYTVAADGTGLALLVRRGDDPDWSSRGEIAYERQRVHWTGGPASECEPVHSLAVLRPGGAPRRVAAGSDPSWAPGGRAIAFVSTGGVRRKQVGASGPGRRLVRRGLLLYEPGWSPDGRLIVYRRGGRLRLTAASRGRVLPLGFDAPGLDFSSSWQPLPR
ncbi:MAG: eukaryotic-like serine/threonine-protein kinase [Thermoleophilaceae bacterium]|jgi:Tol biopolymer transport system component|nr:eukaryotic-like serine/threonine-protein kinase [Thermoleophilaceae bacterium]